METINNEYTGSGVLKKGGKELFLITSIIYPVESENNGERLMFKKLNKIILSGNYLSDFSFNHSVSMRLVFNMKGSCFSSKFEGLITRYRKNELEIEITKPLNCNKL